MRVARYKTGMRAITMAIATAALVAQAYAAQFQVLHTFQGDRDGGDALASMIMDDAGNLFGTTAWGRSSAQCQISTEPPLTEARTM
jgi:hypothetical protein